MELSTYLAGLQLCLLLFSPLVLAQSSFTCQSKDLYNGVMGPAGKPGKSGLPGKKGEPGRSSGVDQNVLTKLKTLEQKLITTNAEMSRQAQTLQKYQAELKRVGDILKDIGKEKPTPGPVARAMPSVPGRPTNCAKVSKGRALSRHSTGGVYNIYPEKIPKGLKVSCDTSTDGGGWMVFQRRQDGSISFEKGWQDYMDGFGGAEGEHWLGLENIHKITSVGKWEMRIDLGDWDNKKKYAKYSQFSLGSAATGYKITVSGFTGDAGDSLMYHSGYKFTTLDMDNDPMRNSNCAVSHRGGWWFYKCVNANLNGVYKMGGKYSEILPIGVIWKHWHGFKYSLKKSEMKIRQVE